MMLLILFFKRKAGREEIDRAWSVGHPRRFIGNLVTSNIYPEMAARLTNDRKSAKYSSLSIGFLIASVAVETSGFIDPPNHYSTLERGDLCVMVFDSESVT